MDSLTTELLLSAYTQGFFPMPDQDTGEVLWYNPDPRAIIPLDGLHISRSLQRTLKRGHFSVTVNQDFPGVMAACAARPETWINEEFIRAYTQLHRQGFAHSLEVWQEAELVGGTYGVSFGGVFCAESMFHRATDASKVALVHLVARMQERGMALLEVQFVTEHLASLGAIQLEQSIYLSRLGEATAMPVSFA